MGHFTIIKTRYLFQNGTPNFWKKIREIPVYASLTFQHQSLKKHTLQEHEGTLWNDRVYIFVKSHWTEGLNGFILWYINFYSVKFTKKLPAIRQEFN